MAQPVSLLTGGQERVLTKSEDILLENLGQPGPQYGGPTVPGANYSMTQAFQGGQGIMGRGNDVNPAIGRMLNDQYDPQAVNQYYQQAFVDPAQQQWRTTQDQLGSRYGDTQGQGGGFARAMGGAANDFNTNLTGQLAQLQFAERQRSNDQQRYGVQAGIAENDNYRKNLMTQLGVGGEQRSVVAQQNQGMLAKWNAAQAYNNPWLDKLMGPVLGTQALGFEPGGGGGGTMSAITGAIGGIGMLAGGVPGLVAGVAAPLIGQAVENA